MDDQEKIMVPFNNCAMAQLFRTTTTIYLIDKKVLSIILKLIFKIRRMIKRYEKVNNSNLEGVICIVIFCSNCNISYTILLIL